MGYTYGYKTVACITDDATYALNDKNIQNGGVVSHVTSDTFAKRLQVSFYASETHEMEKNSFELFVLLAQQRHLLTR